MIPFLYPDDANDRRHGPRGYRSYNRYRPWLRDEFEYRCVYCLYRERWGVIKGRFDIDHLNAQIVDPDGVLRYDNLVYACDTCNVSKGSQSIPDPSECLGYESVVIGEDGSIKGKTKKAQKIIRVLGLDEPDYCEFRNLFIGIVAMARDDDRELFVKVMSYPRNLPDLSRLRPPDGNTRPGGIAQSAHARRARGELPETY